MKKLYNIEIIKPGLVSFTAPLMKYGKPKFVRQLTVLDEGCKTNISNIWLKSFNKNPLQPTTLHFMVYNHGILSLVAIYKLSERYIIS